MISYKDSLSLDIMEAMQKDSFSQYLNSSTTKEEVKRAIGRLKLRKPTGLDNLPKVLLKPYPVNFSFR